MSNDYITISALPKTYATEGEVKFIDLMMNALDPTPDGKLSDNDKLVVSAKLKEFDTNLNGTLYAQEFQKSLENKITDI